MLMYAAWNGPFQNYIHMFRTEMVERKWMGDSSSLREITKNCFCFYKLLFLDTVETSGL